MSAFRDLQIINSTSFDKYGNSIHQSIDTYDNQTVDAAKLIDSKVIDNVYGNDVAARRGNATSSTVARYTTAVASSQTASTMIDKTVTTNSAFDSLGNIGTQDVEIDVPDATLSLL